MIGWMFSLYQQLDMDAGDQIKNQKYHSTKSFIQTNANTLGLMALICLFVYGTHWWQQERGILSKYANSDFFFFLLSVQYMSWANGIFLILPILCWYPVKTFNMFRQLTKFKTWFWIGGIEFLVGEYESMCFQFQSKLHFKSSCFFFLDWLYSLPIGVVILQPYLLEWTVVGAAGIRVLCIERFVHFHFIYFEWIEFMKEFKMLNLLTK